MKLLSKYHQRAVQNLNFYQKLNKISNSLKLLGESILTLFKYILLGFVIWWNFKSSTSTLNAGWQYVYNYLI